MMQHEDQLLARLKSMEGRLDAMELALMSISRDLGNLSGRLKSNSAMHSMVPLLIKFVIFPLIIITGACVGVYLTF